MERLRKFHPQRKNLQFRVSQIHFLRDILRLQTIFSLFVWCFGLYCVLCLIDGMSLCLLFMFVYVCVCLCLCLFKINNDK